MELFLKKHSSLLLSSCIAFFFFSFISSQSYATSPDKQDLERVKIKECVINWTGSKVTGSHEGTVELKSGYLIYNKQENLIGGDFIIDMTSIICTDLSGKGKASLESHLKSADFFDVGNFPLANLAIVSAEKKDVGVYEMTGMITIKNIPQKVVFKANIEERTAFTKLTLDRTLFGIIYKSGNFFKELADKAIYDDFELDIKLIF
tara:strand:- start:3209 stop:3823 length:615 start_codon:yes stop_codon:yes gene_type:complete